MTEKLRQEFEAWANQSNNFDEPAEYTELMMYVRDEHNIAWDAWVHASEKHTQLLNRIESLKQFISENSHDIDLGMMVTNRLDFILERSK